MILFSTVGNLLTDILIPFKLIQNLFNFFRNILPLHFVIFVQITLSVLSTVSWIDVDVDVFHCLSFTKHAHILKLLLLIDNLLLWHYQASNMYLTHGSYPVVLVPLIFYPSFESSICFSER